MNDVDEALAAVRKRVQQDEAWVRAHAHLLCRACWGKKTVQVYHPNGSYHVFIVPCPECSGTGFPDHHR